MELHWGLQSGLMIKLDHSRICFCAGYTNEIYGGVGIWVNNKIVIKQKQKISYKPSYIWAYCGKPASRSQFAASIAWISVMKIKNTNKRWIKDLNVLNKHNQKNMC